MRRLLERIKMRNKINYLAGIETGDSDNSMEIIEAKHMNLLYIIYCIQIALSVSVLIFLFLLGVFNKAPLTNMIKFGFALFTFAVVTGVLSLIITRRIITGMLTVPSKIKDAENANNKLIEEYQKNLADKERLAALGQLAGGITHNLRSPIMSISGAAEALKDLVNEYEKSIDDINVNKEDHHEIAREMMTWVEKIKPYCSYMSELVSAVKGQATYANMSYAGSFSLEELVKRVEMLMNHELKTNHCKMQKDIQVDLNTKIKGEINYLVQILNNLVVNAIHSYDEKGGIINFGIMKNDKNVEFIIRDLGKGIPKEIQDKILKEMITTKGRNGTGLGLFMSYLVVKERFGGEMKFESEEGKGTTFHLVIPFVMFDGERWEADEKKIL